MESFTVNLVLTDPCPTSTLTLSATPFVDSTYVLRDPSQAQSWVDLNLYTVDTLVDCGPIQVEFFNDDATKTALDADIFE